MSDGFVQKLHLVYKPQDNLLWFIFFFPFFFPFISSLQKCINLQINIYPIYRQDPLK